MSVPALAPTSAPSPSSWPLPMQFGKYTLVRKLATGGMAELYLAILRSMAGFEKVVVLKRILPTMTADRDFVEMLLQEARIAATLSHPNIVQTFDVGEHQGTYFIAMEHVHGEDIRGLVRQMKVRSHTSFPLEHAIEIMIGVCKGLTYAHEKRDLDGTPLGIVHRDISPQNIVVSFSGDVKIVDFGIAKTQSKIKLSRRNLEETESGKIKGKIAYMSPEQALGQDVDARSDVFATGIVLYELTTGRRLFRAPSDYETLKLICEQDVVRPTSFRSGYSPELERIVLKALARNKDDRYQSARDLQADLEAFARRNQIEASSVTLSAFMQKLFEGEASHTQEMVLAPGELQHVLSSRPAEDDIRLESERVRMQSTPAASRTITEIRAISEPPKRGRKRLALGAVALAAAAGGVGFWASQSDAPVPAPAVVVEAPVEKTTLTVSSTPAGAAIWIDGDLRPERTPATLRGLPAGRATQVKITLEGFTAFSESITLDEEAPRAIEAPLVAEAKKPAPVASDAVTVADRPKHPQPGAGHAATGAPKSKDPVAVSAPAAKGVGKLNVGASGGWCTVSVDGKSRGATPVAGLELPAGTHTVSCTTADGTVKTSTAVVQADSVARVKFTL